VNRAIARIHIVRHISCTLMTKYILKQVLFGVFLFLATVLLVASLYTRVHETDTIYAQNAETINFQARLLRSNGAIAPDGSYSVEFQLYDSETGGTSQWQETQTTEVRAGYLSVYLGLNETFPSSIDWSQQQWLTMNVDGDGEMTPRIRVTAVPFALQAGFASEAGGLISGAELLEADDFLQTAPLSAQSIDASVAGLRFNQAGSGSLVQLQSDGVNRFVVSRSGNVTATSFSGSGAGLTLLNADNIASGELGDERLSDNVALLDGAQTFSTRITFDDGLTLGGSATNQAGSLRWTGSDFEGYNGSEWVSLTSGEGGGVNGDFFEQDGNEFGGLATLGTTDTEDLRFITDGQERLRITDDGSVGIGTASPDDFLLQVAGSIGPDADDTYDLGSPTQRWRSLYLGSNSLHIGEAGNEIVLSYDTAGERLEIGGELSVTKLLIDDQALKVSDLEDGDALIFQGGSAFGETAVLGTTDAHNLELITDGLTRLSIASSGEVTITEGLSIDSGGLDVVGGITADTLTASGTITADTFSGSGAALTSLDADALSTGQVSDGLLSSNIARLNQAQTFTSTATFDSGMVLGNTSSTSSGTLRWTGSDFQGYNGSEWVSLTSGEGGGVSMLAIGMFYAYDSSGGTAINGWSDLTLDTEVRSDNQFSSLGNGATTVTIQEDGWYEVTYNASYFTTGGGNNQATVQTRVVADTGSGFDEIAGSSSFTFLRTGGGGDATTSNTVLQQFEQGDEIKLQSQRSSGDTFAISTRAGSVNLSIRHITEAGEGASGGGTGLEFTQGGNAFGSRAILGTTDEEGLDIITDGSVALTFSSSGAASFTQGLSIQGGGISVTGDSTISGTLSGLSGLTVASGGLNLSSSGIANTGSITGVGSDITASNGLTVASGNNSNLQLSAASGLLVLDAATWRRTASGTTTIQLNDGSDTTLAITNTGAGDANLQVQGAISANEFSGSGSGLTGLSATNITSGTLEDDRLTSNIARLDESQTFSGLTSFSSGLTVGNTATTSAGTIRWTGSDFQGYNGSEWVSFTGGGSSANLGGILSFGKVAANGSPVSVSGASITRNGTGHYTVTLDNTAPTSDYIVQLTIDDSATSVENISITLANQTDDGFDVYIRESDSGSLSVSLVDKQWHFIVFDDTSEIGSSEGGENGDSSLTFVQGGNEFGSAAIFGTTDAYGINVVVDSSTALSIDALGDAVFNGAVDISGNLLVDGDAAVRGGLLTLGTSTQAGSIVLRDGAGRSATVDVGSLSSSRTYTLPDVSGELCTSAGNCDNGEQNGLLIGGNETDEDIIVGTINNYDFTIKTNDTNRLSISGSSGDLNLLTGGLQTLGTTRLTSGGALQNITGLSIISGGADIVGGVTVAGGVTISTGGLDVSGAASFDSATFSGSLTASDGLSVTGGIDNNEGGVTNLGALSGVTTIDASGNINTSDGALQTGGQTRISNNGALQNISSIDASGIIDSATGFAVDGSLGVSGECLGGNNAYLNNVIVEGGIITSADCRQGGSLSDAQLKENIVSLESSILDGVSLVNTVDFDFKCEESEYDGLGLDCERQTGVIAQELAEIFPELVYEGDDGYLRVRYDALNLYTLRAVSELARVIDSSGTVDAKEVRTDGAIRVTKDGKLQNITGLSLMSGGASIVGGIDNNLGGMSNVGAIDGVTTLAAQTLKLKGDSDGQALRITKEDNDVFSISDNGALQITSSDSHVFGVRNNSGESIFRVDSNSGLVFIGEPSSSAETVLLVLAGRDDASDPEGVEGAQYYNRATQRFRCYQEDRWQDCIPTAISEYLLLSTSSTWQASDTLTSLDDVSQLWLDTSSVHEARLQLEVRELGEAQSIQCQIEYAFEDDLSAWNSLFDEAIVVDQAMTIRSDWQVLPEKVIDASEEILIRVSCSDGSDDNEGSQPTVTMRSIRLQTR
jgi:hypothetical protein